MGKVSGSVLNAEDGLANTVPATRSFAYSFQRFTVLTRLVLPISISALLIVALVTFT